MTLDSLLKTLRLSLLHPRAGMRAVLDWRLTLQDSALALLLMAVVSAGLLSLVVGPVPAEMDPVSAALLTNPIYLAAMHLVGLGMIALFLHLLGRLAKGRGTLPEAVAMMAWLEAVLIVVSVAQSLIVLLLPPTALILLPLGIILNLWLITSFVAELHGFRSLVLTLLGVIAAFIAAAIAIVFALLLAVALGILHVPG